MNMISKFLVLFLGLSMFTPLFADKVLVAGSGWNKLMILDKNTGKSEWTYEIPGHAECNGVAFTRDRKVFYANKKNARLVGLDKETVWEYQAEPKEEIQTALLLKNGNFLLGICGRPARIVELSKAGKPLKEIKFDTRIENIHGQFRQLAVTKRGTYIVSLWDRRCTIELDKYGKTINEIPVPFAVFSTKELPSGNWLVSGAGGNISEIDPKTREIVRSISNKNLDGAKLLFATETQPLKNGNLMVANWNGHSDDKSQPKLLEIDKNNRVAWALKSDEDIKNISAFFIIGR